MTSSECALYCIEYEYDVNPIINSICITIKMRMSGYVKHHAIEKDHELNFTTGD